MVVLSKVDSERVVFAIPMCNESLTDRDTNLPVLTTGTICPRISNNFAFELWLASRLELLVSTRPVVKSIAQYCHAFPIDLELSVIVVAEFLNKLLFGLVEQLSLLFSSSF